MSCDISSFLYKPYREVIYCLKNKAVKPVFLISQKRQLDLYRGVKIGYSAHKSSKNISAIERKIFNSLKILA
jgi:5'(3')-deoxyribonucleotidase